MNRRAFLTALSAIPAVALFPGLLRAQEPAFSKATLYSFYRVMDYFGDQPDALFMSEAAMQAMAKVFKITPAWNEFKSPYGGDICGTLDENNRIQVVAGFGPREPGEPSNRTTLYLFRWGEDAFIRHEAGRLAVSYKVSETIRRYEERYQEFMRVSDQVQRGRS